MNYPLISAWSVGNNSLSADLKAPLQGVARFSASEEKIGDFFITYDLPSEEELKNDGGCSAFLAKTTRKERKR